MSRKEKESGSHPPQTSQTSTPQMPCESHPTSMSSTTPVVIPKNDTRPVSSQPQRTSTLSEVSTRSMASSMPSRSSNPGSQHSPLSPTHRNSSTSGTPTSPPVLLHLEIPSMLDMWTLCQQIGFMYHLFINRITVITISSSSAKILQKNLMYKISDEALTIADEFATLIHNYLSTQELGQRKDPRWSLRKAPRFRALHEFAKGSSVTIFGERLGKKLDLGELYVPPYAPINRFRSNPDFQGIPHDHNECLVKEIAIYIGDWKEAITDFIEKFDPYHLPVAVTLMVVTANKLRTAASRVIHIVEVDYRIALGLVPIEGTCQAELVQNAIIKEHEQNLKEEVKEYLLNVAWETEKRINIGRNGKNRMSSGSYGRKRSGWVDGIERVSR